MWSAEAASEAEFGHSSHGLKALVIRTSGNLLSAAKAASVDSLSVGRSGKPDRTAKGQAQTGAECGVRKLSAEKRRRPPTKADQGLGWSGLDEPTM